MAEASGKMAKVAKSESRVVTVVSCKTEAEPSTQLKRPTNLHLFLVRDVFEFATSSELTWPRESGADSFSVPHVGRWRCGSAVWRNLCRYSYVCPPLPK
jgi:hypothetical protein